MTKTKCDIYHVSKDGEYTKLSEQDLVLRMMIGDDLDFEVEDSKDLENFEDGDILEIQVNVNSLLGGFNIMTMEMEVFTYKHSGQKDLRLIDMLKR